MAKSCEFGKHWLTQSLWLCPGLSPSSCIYTANTWLVLKHCLWNYYHIFKSLFLWYIMVTIWPLHILPKLDFHITRLSNSSSTFIVTEKQSSCNGKSQMILADDFMWCVTCHYNSHISQWILLGNWLSFEQCLLVRLSPKGAACRADFMSQKERHATKPAFLVFHVTAVLGLDRVNMQTRDWTFTY